MAENLVKIDQALDLRIENPTNPELDLQKILRSFTEKNNSPATRRTYAAHLREFFLFARAANGAAALRITSETVVNWREAMIRKGNKPAHRQNQAGCRPLFLRTPEASRLDPK